MSVLKSILNPSWGIKSIKKINHSEAGKNMDFSYIKTLMIVINKLRGKLVASLFLAKIDFPICPSTHKF